MSAGSIAANNFLDISYTAPQMPAKGGAESTDSVDAKAAPDTSVKLSALAGQGLAILGQQSPGASAPAQPAASSGPDLAFFGVVPQAAQTQDSSGVLSIQNVLAGGVAMMAICSQMEAANLTNLYNQIQYNNQVSEQANTYATELEQAAEGAQNNTGSTNPGTGPLDITNVAQFEAWCNANGVTIGGLSLSDWLSSTCNKSIDAENFTPQEITDLEASVKQAGSASGDANQTLMVQLQELNSNYNNDVSGESALVQKWMGTIATIISALGR